MVCSTLLSRGKSCTPESRIEMLDERSAFVDRRDDTQDDNGFAIISLLGERLLIFGVISKCMGVIFTARFSRLEPKRERQA